MGTNVGVDVPVQVGVDVTVGGSGLVGMYRVRQDVRVRMLPAENSRAKTM